eukprot:PhM_4_TR14387/c0_g1_i1/m.60983
MRENCFARVGLTLSQCKHTFELTVPMLFEPSMRIDHEVKFLLGKEATVSLLPCISWTQCIRWTLSENIYMSHDVGRNTIFCETLTILFCMLLDDTNKYIFWVICTSK